MKKNLKEHLKKNFLIFYLCLNFISLLSCEALFNLNQNLDYKKVNIGTSHNHVHIPKLLSEVLSQKYIEYIRRTNEKSNLTDEEIVVRIPRSPLNVNLRLTEKTKGVLNSNVIVHFPEGGGVIDLASFVSGKKGSFYVQFDVFKKSSDKAQKEVFKNFMLLYSSHTRKTQFGGSSFGTQCGKLLDLTSYGYKFLQGKGLLVKTGGSMDSSSIEYLGGSFYFIYFRKKYLHIGAIRFIDSRFSHLQCQSLYPIDNVKKIKEVSNVKKEVESIKKP